MWIKAIGLERRQSNAGYRCIGLQHTWPGVCLACSNSKQLRAVHHELWQKQAGSAVRLKLLLPSRDAPTSSCDSTVASNSCLHAQYWLFPKMAEIQSGKTCLPPPTMMNQVFSRAEPGNRKALPTENLADRRMIYNIFDGIAYGDWQSIAVTTSWKVVRGAPMYACILLPGLFEQILHDIVSLWM